MNVVVGMTTLRVSPSVQRGWHVFAVFLNLQYLVFRLLQYSLFVATLCAMA